MLFHPNFVKDPEVLRFFEIKPVTEGPSSSPSSPPVAPPRPTAQPAPVNEHATANSLHVEDEEPQNADVDPLLLAVQQQFERQAHLESQPSSVTSERSTAAAGSAGAYEGRYAGNTEEEVLCAWLEDLLQERVDPSDLQGGLRSGVVLCNLVNRIVPGTIKRISQSDAPFPQRENIKAFVDAVKQMGLRDTGDKKRKRKRRKTSFTCT